MSKTPTLIFEIIFLHVGITCRVTSSIGDVIFDLAHLAINLDSRYKMHCDVEIKPRAVRF
jgi:hypothetical protein